MNNRTNLTTVDPGRALENRGLKAGDFKSGAIRARAVKSRVRTRRRAAQPISNSIVTRSSACIEPGNRDALIAEAAYFRSAHRGFEPGHEVDDWLASECEIDAAMARGDLPQFME
jgi:hypothetical protein